MKQPHNLLRQPWLRNTLRQSDGARSIAYFGSMVAIIGLARMINGALVQDTKSIWYRDMTTPAFPAVLALTYAFTRLKHADRASWQQSLNAANLKQLTQGLVLGTAAMSSVFGIAATQGWVSSPAWGWEHTSGQALAWSVTIVSIQLVLAAWEEEMVFRGYGLDTLRQAVGPVAAITISTLLFALYHGIDARRIVAMVIGGLMLTTLRLQSGGLWLPVGFHLAWNMIQYVVFGPIDDLPSLRPIVVSGPEQWIGEAGSPEPGLLSMAVLALIAIVVGYRVWRSGNTFLNHNRD